MSGQNLTYTKGELIALSTGEYSDYCVNGLVRALKDFDASVLLEEWAAENAVLLEDTNMVRYTRKVCREKENGMSFLGWLNKNGYTEDVKYRELHTGSYDDVELSEW
ncbi:hypothetical protein ACEOHO_004104 [Vibrio vulnificus]